MVIDYQHHYTPREFERPRPRAGRGAEYTNGNPSHTFNPLIGDLDAHIPWMDAVGIDAAVLSCPRGMDNPDLGTCRRINDKLKEAEEKYPGRFIGIAHVPVRGEGFADELSRCRKELGFCGAVTVSEPQGLGLDASELDPYYAKLCDLGLYLFVHPLLTSITYRQLDDDYDLQRTLGREFSLMTATLRMINGGVLDRFPGLRPHMSHLAGGLAPLLGRVRHHQDRELVGVADHPRHGRLPEKDLMHYLHERLVFDTAGVTGEVNAVKAALLEIPSSRIVFGTDYPQEFVDLDHSRSEVAALRALGQDGPQILEGNHRRLLSDAVLRRIHRADPSG